MVTHYALRFTFYGSRFSIEPSPVPCSHARVSGLQRFLRGWLPVVLWMGVIFAASTDLMSSANTSRFIGPILRWLKPDVSEETIRLVQMVVRKGGHVTEYAVLAALLLRALRGPGANPHRTWSWSAAGLVLAVAVLYAASDELHQHFVASRYASAWDVMIDSLGAALGVGALWVHGRWKHWW